MRLHLLFCLFFSVVFACQSNALFGQQQARAVPNMERLSTQKLEKPYAPPGQLAIVRQPDNQTVCLGQAVRFVVGVEGGSDGLPRFQWQSSTNGGKNWTDIKGANQPYYDEIRSVSRSYHGLLLRVQVKAGEQEVCSKTAALLIQNLLNFDTKIANQVSAEGGSVRFDTKIDLSSLPDETYFQWQKTRYGTAVWEDLAGENRLFLKMDNIKKEENGSQVRLFIYGPSLCDTIWTDVGFLSVLPIPEVAVTPGQSSFCGGGTATFSIIMDGATGLERVQWQRSTNDGLSYQDIPGAQGLYHLLSDIQPEMTGHRYRAKMVLPGDVHFTTHEAVVTVYGAVSFAEKPRNQTVCYGDEAVFKIKANYRGNKPSYQWQVDKNGNGEFEQIEGAEAEEYRVQTDKVEANGWRFRALINVGACNAIETEPAKLLVLSDLNFLLQPVDNKVMLEEDDATFVANFEGEENDFSVSWQWSANDGATWLPVPNSSSKKLVVSRVKQDMASYKYRMRVMNKKCGRIFYTQAAGIVIGYD